ncbi:hypothetical protein AWENTII_006064 [Aspergillus wentii]
MASQGVNVLRYSALVTGLVYGVYHQSSLNSQTRRAETDREYARKERLIEQAKAEWKKKTSPQETKSQSSGRMSLQLSIPSFGCFLQRSRHLARSMLTRKLAVITDPEDSRFDLEAFLNAKAKETN